MIPLPRDARLFAMVLTTLSALSLTACPESKRKAAPRQRARFVSAVCQPAVRKRQSLSIRLSARSPV
jgi:hypothetical protein